MLVSEKIAKYFDGNVRSRGRDYFLRGAVKITRAQRGDIEAQVRGSMTYLVELVRDDDAMIASCTCPHYEEGAFCKHIWATVLTAESKRLLAPAEDDAPFSLLAEYDDDEETDAPFSLDDEPSALATKVLTLFTHPGALAEPAGRGARAAASGARAKKSPAPAPRQPQWRTVMARLNQVVQSQSDARTESLTQTVREIVYFIDVAATLAQGALILDVNQRELKTNGEWGKPKNQRIPFSQVAHLPEPADRRILSFLVGAKEHSDWTLAAHDYASAPTRYRLSEPMIQALLPMMCETGRCRLRRHPESADLGEPLAWDPRPWTFHLEINRGEAPEPHYLVSGSLRRGEERMEISEPVMLLAGGVVFTAATVSPLTDSGTFFWIGALRQEGVFRAPVADGAELLEKVLMLPDAPPMDLPPDLRFETVAVAPSPALRIRPPDKRTGTDALSLRGELAFDYAGIRIDAARRQRGMYDPATRRYVRRDVQLERAAAERLRAVGFRPEYNVQRQSPEFRIAPNGLTKAVRALVEDGWCVEADGKAFRQPGKFHLEVRSSVDWFELHGTVDFGAARARLPELLKAIQRGQNTVQLDDGSYGLLPEDWLTRYGVLVGLGTEESDHVRFAANQVGLLDALLLAQPDAAWDEGFQKARAALESFTGVQAVNEPPGFVGELRPYQREGLGWLRFLQEFGFGGCLADAMGLGKTAQALALLEMRRAARTEGKGAPPSLVVAPRSLIFNWQQEAEKFTPRIRVLDHTGAVRAKNFDGVAEKYDLVLTTYGTLRRDAALFKDFEFDYVILDEAQAIKNSDTESAKAARLLRGRHRVALSGTPVENHLGELWSLFEFLNPGMLGAASVFQMTGAQARNPEADTRELLARGLRPFILRRTKEQVAADLPPKSEQTIYCQMGEKQRKLYDELRDHYRQVFLDGANGDGWGKSKLKVLEALLRLRQAACHPGLLDKRRVSEPSAKIDTLMPQVLEVLEGGQKVLVFSQFTSLLAIVRGKLEKAGITYEYLDGRTRDRGARVERFQTDPECRLFLISLKAGGVGLNLTAAEYVFLLDPWWNPAVEAQAIDRAHRIGQTRRVFAYRLIVKDSVEEKVLQLQETKRDLADAIVGADNNIIKNLERRDLELLLS
jgi:superfamily II DNA or RNA helicase